MSNTSVTDRASLTISQFARRLLHHRRHSTGPFARALALVVTLFSGAGGATGVELSVKRRASLPELQVTGFDHHHRHDDDGVATDADAVERGLGARGPAGSLAHVSTGQQHHAQPPLSPSLGPDAMSAAATRRTMEALEQELRNLSPTSMARMSSSSHLSSFDASVMHASAVRNSGGGASTSSDGAPGDVVITPRGSNVLGLPGSWSHIVTSGDELAWLTTLLPPLLRSLPWRCLYATRRDGTSLASLLRASAGTTGPALLLVADVNGYAFGAFTSDSWCVHASGKRSYGTGECFVFTLRPFRQIWRWDRAGARVFQVSSNEALSLGGAPHFAFWLDAELRCGSSGTCSTFNSPCLASSSEFHIASVELYHFGSDGAAIAQRRDNAAGLDESRRAALLDGGGTGVVADTR